MLVLLGFVSQLSADEFTVEKVMREYPKLFKISGISLSECVIENPTGLLSLLVEENRFFLNYLIHRTMSEDSLYKVKSDTAALQKKFFELLTNNKRFNAIFLPMADSHLKAHNYQTANFPQKLSEDSLTVDDIMQTALRFIYPFRVDNQQQLYTHFCIGGNALHDYDKKNIVIEAFCFQLVLEELKTNREGFFKDYTNIEKNVMRVYYSSNKEVNMERIRGAIWSHLFDNQILRKVLLQNYEKRKKILPFYLKSEIINIEKKGGVHHDKK